MYENPGTNLLLRSLDGSPPAVYVRAGTGTGAAKFVLFMEGGGWCFSPSDCAGRAHGGLGSSLQNGPTKEDFGGVMAVDPATNPAFHSWTMVFLRYCDGSSMSSDRAAPLAEPTAPNGTIWFRGRPNLRAQLALLVAEHGLGEATEVVLSGGSAGGLAVYYHLDFVAELVGKLAPGVRVTGFPDAGYFADLKTVKGASQYRGWFQGADSCCWNTTASVGSNAACVAAETAEPWKCVSTPASCLQLQRNRGRIPRSPACFCDSRSLATLLTLR